LGYISSNTFFRTGTGKPLRSYLLREATIEGIVDFGDLQIFEGVTTYPAILTMKKTPAPEDHEIRFWKVSSPPGDNFQAEWESAAGPYPQAALGSGPWELEEERLRLLREKIRVGKKTLVEVYGSPLYGIKTGLNDAFVIDTPTKERLCSEDPRSAELLKPFLRGRDLKLWRTEPNGRWLIYIPKNRIDIDDYPAIRGWLLPFRGRLEKRATKQEWFELQQAQEGYREYFEGVKVIYPHFNAERNFSLETTGALSNDKSYILPSNDMVLPALLNSKVLWFMVSSISPPVRGGYHELRVQYVEQLPIPNWNDAQQKALSKAGEAASNATRRALSLQEGFRRRIPDLCPPERESRLNRKLEEWWTLPDFSAFRTQVKRVFKADIPLAERSEWDAWIARDRAEIARLTVEIRQAEAKIDRIVYDLFGLNPNEIVLLEDSIR